MKQFKYVLLDFKQRRGLVFSFLILTTVMLTLLSLFTKSLIQSYSGVESLKSFENQNSYYVVDDTSDYMISDLLDNEKEVIKKELSFLKELNQNYKYVIEYGYDIDITSSGNVFSQRVVNNSFFELYNINLYRGRFFSEKEYEKKQEVIPVLIGYDLKEEYSLGERYEFINGGTGEDFQGEIVGILENNSDFYEFNYSDIAISLDNTYIVPIFENYQEKDMSFSDIDMAISHLIVFSDTISEIQQKHNALNTFKSTFINCDNRIANIVDIQINNILFSVMILTIFLFLILVLLWISFNKMIKQQTKEYGIHIMCGATFKNIFSRFAIFVYTILFVACILPIILSKDLLVIGIILLFAVVMGIIILIFPYYQIKKLSVIKILRS